MSGSSVLCQCRGADAVSDTRNEPVIPSLSSEAGGVDKSLEGDGNRDQRDFGEGEEGRATKWGLEPQ